MNTTNEGLKIGHIKADEAASHAGTEWKDVALAAFKQYAKNHSHFTTEQVRLASTDTVPSPPDTRAWGGIARIAKLKGFILSNGWVRAESKTVHGMVVTRWKSTILQTHE